METPPINCLTNEFALIKAYMPPTYINLLNKFGEEKSKENRINKIKETIIWIKSKENKFLSQDLKNHEVEVMLRDIKAKGDRRMNTFIIMYLKE